MDDQHAEPGAGPRREPWPAWEAESSADRQQACVTWRELVAVVLMVVLADLTLFRGYGLAGYAAFFLGALLLLPPGAPRPRFPATFWIVGLMLLAVTARLIWAGWGLPVVCGFVLLVALAMALVGIRPYVLELIGYLIHQYNVRRIMAGDSAPSVQLSVHPISAEGILVLFPLIDCPDSIVREGVLALLADRHDEAERLATRRDREGWTSYQVVDQLLLERLRAHQTHWAEYSDPSRRQQARARFDQYAYQWF